MISKKQSKLNKKSVRSGLKPVARATQYVLQKANNLKHGLLSQRVVLAGENKRQFNQLKNSLTSQLRPQGALESMLVDRIVSSWWRLARAVKAEGEVIDERTESLGERFSTDHKYKGVFLKHLRYETAIERQMYRALHELIRLQMYRRGVKTPAPLAIDIDVASGRV